MRLLLLTALAASLSAASSEERRAAYPTVFALTDLARNAAPEFAARGLLQLLDNHAIPTPDWQIEIAREALTLAGSARHPLPKRLAPGIGAADSSAMLWNTAYAQGLDALTLSLHAVEHLRRLDAMAAQEAFAHLSRPVPAQPTCKDALIDDVTIYYTAASRFQNTDLLPLIQAIQSHADLAPVLDLILQSARSNEELDALAGAFGEKLRILPASDRAFSAAVFHTPPKIAHLHRALVARDRPTAALADGWRSWMQTGLEASACQESRPAGPIEQARHDAFDLFNATVQPPLAAALLKPAGEAIAADLKPFVDTDATREQARRFRELLFGTQSRALSPAEKDTPEWREALQKFIQSIESRTRAADESDVEYFYRQSQLWASVLMAAPPGATRDRALQQFLAFLLANAPHIDPLIWFSQLESMAEVTRSLHGSEFTRLLAALHQSAHPVLQLYAALEAAYPTRPQVR